MGVTLHAPACRPAHCRSRHAPPIPAGQQRCSAGPAPGARRGCVARAVHGAPAEQQFALALSDGDREYFRELKDCGARDLTPAPCDFFELVRSARSAGPRVRWVWRQCTCCCAERVLGLVGWRSWQPWRPWLRAQPCGHTPAQRRSCCFRSVRLVRLVGLRPKERCRGSGGRAVAWCASVRCRPRRFERVCALGRVHDAGAPAAPSGRGIAVAGTRPRRVNGPRALRRAQLGVDLGAGAAEVKASYRTLARLVHPDIAGESATEMAALLNVAYATLASDHVRSAYAQDVRGPPARAPRRAAPRVGRRLTIQRPPTADRPSGPRRWRGTAGTWAASMAGPSAAGTAPRPSSAPCLSTRARAGPGALRPAPLLAPDGPAADPRRARRCIGCMNCTSCAPATFHIVRPRG